jgi:hypothetical protein
MRRKPQERLFTAVGYGATAAVPFPVPGDNRLQATTRLIEIRGTHGIPAGTSAKFSNNGGRNHTGGTCFGDSGGPYFEQGTTLIGAIVSYGLSPCVGNDGAYRIDKAADLMWIRSFL